MTPEIKKAIEESLPQIASATVLERLQEADRLEKSAREMKQRLDSDAKALDQFRQRIAELDEEKTQWATLQADQAKLAEDRRQLDITMLKEHLVAHKLVADHFKDVALGLVRNAEYRREVFKTESDGGSRYCMTTNQNVPITNESTTTTETTE